MGGILYTLSDHASRSNVHTCTFSGDNHNYQWLHSVLLLTKILCYIRAVVTVQVIYNYYTLGSPAWVCWQVCMPCTSLYIMSHRANHSSVLGTLRAMSWLDKIHVSFTVGVVDEMHISWYSSNKHLEQLSVLCRWVVCIWYKTTKVSNI